MQPALREKRGRLMALSVEDRYMRIMMSKGADVVLLRLSDAMRETGDVSGCRCSARIGWRSGPSNAQSGTAIRLS